MWATIHPLTDPGATDQMKTEYATSQDGLAWTWQGTALSGRAGEWDSCQGSPVIHYFSGDNNGDLGGRSIRRLREPPSPSGAVSR
jgi:hypothetical protein